MEKTRYEDLQYGDEVLSPEELQEGWHFCNEWDFMLVGPGMKEMDFCICDLPKKEK